MTILARACACSVLLAAAACAPERDTALRQGPASAADGADGAGDTSSADGQDGADGQHGGGIDSGGDTGAGLVWAGDLAAYEGCEELDPPAKLLSQTLPATDVAAGTALTGELVFANCSGVSWQAATSLDAVSGVKLGAVTDTVMGEWGQPRTLLPADVPPDHAVRIHHGGTAPIANGVHVWQWQLVDEWVAWIEAPSLPADLTVSGGVGPFWVHDRADWEASGYPVDGPTIDLTDLEYVTIHYTGVTIDLDGDDDVWTDDDMIRLLRDTQAYYVDHRGYSIGYNSAIGLDGDEWEARGYDFRSGANGCTDVNRKGYAILVPTPAPEAEPTVAQVEGTRAAILRVRRAAAAAGNPRLLTINGHRDVRSLCGDGGATACPGDPLVRRILDGAFEP